jgi:predicted flap endonuclease-1-like 5' DNA nuclease
MKKIRMQTTSAGPNGSFKSGQVLLVPRDISKEQAKAFVKGGFAEVVKLTDVEKATRAPGEKAVTVEKDVRAQTSPPVLSEFEGVGPKTLEALHEMGVKTVEDMSLASVEDLETIDRVGRATAEKWISMAISIIED